MLSLMVLFNLTQSFQVANGMRKKPKICPKISFILTAPKHNTQMCSFGSKLVEIGN